MFAFHAYSTPLNHPTKNWEQVSSEMCETMEIVKLEIQLKLKCGVF